MKDGKKILSAVFVTAGLSFLFLPVSGEYSAAELLALWRSEHMAWFLCLCAAILSIGAAAPVTLYSRRRGAAILAAVMEIGGGTAIWALVELTGKEPVLPGIGCLSMTVCVLAAGVLSVLSGSGAKELEAEANDFRQENYAREETAADNFSPTYETDFYGTDTFPGKTEFSGNFRKGCLSVSCPPFQGASILLEHMEPVTIGTDPSCCNLVLQGEEISRKHCTISYNGVSNTYLLLDTSTNGTYLEGGQRIPRSFAMELHEGISVYLARPEYRLVFKGENDNTF
ncbi:MAG: FHA domain-containing protein [Clostridiales bacterium]|nr:FHA domain-containing protein [Clostridiales bacterium]